MPLAQAKRSNRSPPGLIQVPRLRIVTEVPVLPRARLGSSAVSLLLAVACAAAGCPSASVAAAASARRRSPESRGGRTGRSGLHGLHSSGFSALSCDRAMRRSQYLDAGQTNSHGTVLAAALIVEKAAAGKRRTAAESTPHTQEKDCGTADRGCLMLRVKGRGPEWERLHPKESRQAPGVETHRHRPPAS